jgi:hypothetical protein
MAIFRFPGALAIQRRAQCIFDNQEPPEFLGRDIKCLRPVGGSSWGFGSEPEAFEPIT